MSPFLESCFWRIGSFSGPDRAREKQFFTDRLLCVYIPCLSERVIVNGHGCHTALHFGVKAKENQDKVPTLYWLPKRHKKPYKARFIANSSSCTTTELSELLTSCLTDVKNMLSSFVKRYMRDPVKTYFGLLKIQAKF